MVSAFISVDAGVETEKVFSGTGVSQISGRIWAGTVCNRVSSD